MLADLWRNNRTAVLIVGLLATAAVGLFAMLLAVGAHGTDRASGVAAPRTAATAPQQQVPVSATVPAATAAGSRLPVPGMSTATHLTGPQQAQARAALATEARVLADSPSIRPATSTSFPAVPDSASSQPLLFAQAFAKQLFDVDFDRDARTALLSWAQYESAPMFDDGNGIALADRAKLLALSLTDPTTTNAGTPIVPTTSQWQSLAAQSATQTATVTASPDPQWEAELAAGYSSPDRLTTWVDVSAQVTTRVHLGRTTTTHRQAVAFRLLLGTSARGRYGAVAVYGYLSRTVN